MPLNDRDYDLLSLYINDALTPAEQRDVESRLASDAEFRDELAALRQTVTLIKNMPEMIALRDLRLSPAMVSETLADYAEPRPVVRARVSAIRVLTNFAAAAASFVLVMAGVFTLTQPAPPAMSQYPQVALSSTQIEPTIAFDEEAPPMVFMAVEPALTEDTGNADMAAPENAALLQMNAPGTDASTEEVESAAGMMDAAPAAAEMMPEAAARQAYAQESPDGNSAGAGNGPDDSLIGEVTEAASNDASLHALDTTREKSSDMPAVSPLIGFLLIAAGLTLGATTLLIRSRP